MQDVIILLQRTSCLLTSALFLTQNCPYSHTEFRFNRGERERKKTLRTTESKSTYSQTSFLLSVSASICFHMLQNIRTAKDKQHGPKIPMKQNVFNSMKTMLQSCQADRTRSLTLELGQRIWVFGL